MLRLTVQSTAEDVGGAQRTIVLEQVWKVLIDSLPPRILLL